MSYQAVMQFLESTSTDASLRSTLATLMGAGDGDISSAAALDAEEAQALLGELGVRVATLAEEKGFKFSLGELNAVISVFHRYNAGELSEEDFARAMGWDTAAQPPAKELQSVGETVNRVYRGVRHAVERNKGSATNVLEFMKMTSENADLRAELKDLLAVGDGDIGGAGELDAEEAEALKSERGVLVAEFAAKKGYLFTLSDLLAVTDAFERVQAGELNDDEFERFLSVNVNAADFFPFISNVVSMTYKGFKYTSPVVARVKSNTLPVVRFIERSGNDSALQSQLMAIIGGDGDISSPVNLDAQEASALSGEQSAQIVSLGAEHGYLFTVADLNAVVTAFQLVNEDQMSMASCKRILGMDRRRDDGGVRKTAGMIYRGVRH